MNSAEDTSWVIKGVVIETTEISQTESRNIVSICPHCKSVKIDNVTFTLIKLGMKSWYLPLYMWTLLFIWNLAFLEKFYNTSYHINITCIFRQ